MDPEVAACRAAALIGDLLGSADVRLMSSNGVDFLVFPAHEDEDHLGLSVEGRVAGHAALMKLGAAGVTGVDADGLLLDPLPADGRHGGPLLALALSIGDASGEDVFVAGPWSPQRAAEAGRLLEAAGPALALVLERILDTQRRVRVREQMEALSQVARVFTRAKKMPQVLADVVHSLGSATGLTVTIDVVDSRGRILLRSIGAGRFNGTPLEGTWRRLVRAPDPVCEMILRDLQPVLLPDLQHDPRISEAARDFYRRTAIVSGATFPLIFQDHVVGLMRFGSMKPLTFPPEEVEMLRDMAAQAAVVVKGVQLWDELQRSRKETERYASRLQASMEIQHHLARTDHLCGIPNRRHLDEVIAAECARAARYGSQLTLALADLDHFKLVNDEHGHDAGDAVLRQVAMIARGSCRKVDIVGRMGGDEFLFVLPATGLRRALTWAQRFRRSLETTPVRAVNGIAVGLTVSVGVAEADPQCLGDPKLLVRRCDEALYAAKNSGRNQVRAHRLRVGPATRLGRAAKAQPPAARSASDCSLVSASSRMR